MPLSETILSGIPAWAILTLLAAACATYIVSYFSIRACNYIVVAGTFISLLLVLSMYPAISAGKIYLKSFAILPPTGLAFRVDRLGIFMGLLFSFFALIIALYIPGYFRGKENNGRFFTFFLLAAAGCLGVVLSGNMFTLFLFFEFMSLMFFVLVAHEATPGAYAASMKFFFMTIIAGVTLFWAITITYRATGSLDFGYGGLVSAGTPLLLTAFVCYLVGFGIKAALVPLHLWMPDAYAAAPVPAAALSSMLMLKTGVYGLIRVFYDLYGAAFIKGAGWHYIVLILAACSIIYGSLCAIAQDDLIRRLAYSGMAQVSYIILGLAMLSENALTGLLYHIMAHAFMKGCLFLCAGAIIMQTGKRKISELGGIGQQMPLVMIAFTVAGVSAVGIPPFNVFVSKWYLSLGALDIHQPLFIVLLLLSSIMNAAYYLPISMAAFFGFPGGTSPNITKKMGAAIIIPIVILAVGAFAFTLAPQNWPLNLAKIIAHSIFN